MESRNYINFLRKTLSTKYRQNDYIGKCYASNFHSRFQLLLEHAF